MMKLFSLVLPVLIPSWRFFKTIEPSPRIQWALFSKDGAILQEWADFRPQPESISPLQMLGRLFWNPARGEVLFALACAERISRQPTAHSIAEINRRILQDLRHMPLETSQAALQFRLIFVEENTAEILYHSPLRPLWNEAGHEF